MQVEGRMLASSRIESASTATDIGSTGNRRSQFIASYYAWLVVERATRVVDINVLPGKKPILST